jgi:DNA-binding NarL/FixJ family response regulator
MKSRDPFINNEICKRLKEDIGMDTQTYHSIEELFPLLSNPYYNVDHIVIDIEGLYSVDDTDVFDVINTLQTLIRCTVERANNVNKPVRRRSKIVALVSTTTPVNLIKEVLKAPSISSVLARVDEVNTYEEGLKDFVEYLGGRMGAGRLVINMLKKPRPLKKLLNSEIVLTPRQQQIMELICSKGASNKIIARTLAISESTVKLHVGHIFKKYGVRSRTQLAVFNRR